MKFALRRRGLDRLGYWTCTHGKLDLYYTLGSPTQAHALEGRYSSQRLLRYGQPLFLLCTAYGLVAGFVWASGLNPAMASSSAGGGTARFLHSFLPSLLGMAVFLHFQSLDLKLRILHPLAAAPSQDGTTANRRLLFADYAACALMQSSIHEVRNCDWAVAASSLLSTLFVLIPILASRTFAAPALPDSAVRIFANLVASGVMLALPILPFLALLALLALLAWIPPPGRSFCALHLAMCLAGVLDCLASEEWGWNLQGPESREASRPLQ
ncbi:hypothetical protein B0H63DRAFT_536774 [Podospora didyma]|uniref:Uncharacterized protein n=1 Tax=Podospora didyma TaxID=330526 RepID=A0AAE0JYC7_9PEZI|nr:hypothetical protein B0H63DRAFT_536774 [Podospora didyma]